MKYKIFITGATGFIGGALIARLIKTDKWDECIFLVRADQREDGLARLAHVLRAHQTPEDAISKLRLDQIICGDLVSVSDWINDPRLQSIEDVVSSAAVASFGNHSTIFPVNVDGVLEMATVLHSRCKLRRFLQIGTAMASGTTEASPVPEGFDAGDDTEHFLQYTRSKYTAEKLLRSQLPTLPLVVARPSIVIGHTKLGCLPSGSIFWVFRLARALNAFPCELSDRIDVVPVDFAAKAIHVLMTKENLQFDSYHISAGMDQSCSFGDIDRAIALADKVSPMTKYKAMSTEDIAKKFSDFKELIGPCNRRIILKAVHAYGSFASSGMLFDNARLLREGLEKPTAFSNYAGLCELTSKSHLISEQMKFDYK
jgi:nucleoside-diphosphate-sugar epimerase